MHKPILLSGNFLLSFCYPNLKSKNWSNKKVVPAKLLSKRWSDL